MNIYLSVTCLPNELRGILNNIYSSKEVLHHLDFFHILSDILTNKFLSYLKVFEFAQSERI